MLLSELLAICRREMAGVRDAAPGEAEILVSAVTGIPRGRLFLSMHVEVGDASVRLVPLIARRAAGEPLQYVLGAWDFFGGSSCSPPTRSSASRDGGAGGTGGGGPSSLPRDATPCARRGDRERGDRGDSCRGGSRGPRCGHRHLARRVADGTRECGAPRRGGPRPAGLLRPAFRLEMRGPICCSGFEPSVRRRGEGPLLPAEVRDHEPPGALLAGRTACRSCGPGRRRRRLLSPGGEVWCEIGASQGEAASSLPCGLLRPLGVFPDLAGRDRYVGWKKPERER